MGLTDITRWPLGQVTVNVADHLSGMRDIAAGELGLWLAQQRTDFLAGAVANRFTAFAGLKPTALDWSVSTRPQARLRTYSQIV